MFFGKFGVDAEIIGEYTIGVMRNFTKQMAYIFNLIDKLFIRHSLKVILDKGSDRFYRTLYIIKIGFQIHCTGCTFQMKHLVSIAFSQGFDGVNANIGSNT